MEECDVGKHSAQRRSPLPLVLGVVALVAIAAAAFFGFRILTRGDGGGQAAAPPPTSTSTAGSTTTGTTSSSPTTTASPAVAAEFAAVQKALQECVARDSAAKAAAAAATTGADHWAAHLQGQSDIQSGAKTYIDVKTNVFGPTKAAGPGDIAAFDGAMTAYNGVGGCQNVGSVQAPADLSPKLQACAAREQAIDTYMGAAKAVMDDWRTHLQEMADHTDGHLTGSDGQARWIERWRAAPAHLDPYKNAQAALSSAPACSA
ncbi:MAG: hypothetical protein ABJA74_09235 [Lapillicoccus sp.]